MGFNPGSKKQQIIGIFTLFALFTSIWLLYPTKLKPKVLIITFTDEEASLWKQNLSFPYALDITGIDQLLYYNSKTKVALITTSPGSINAIQTIMALGLSKKINLAHTYLIANGLAFKSLKSDIPLGSVIVSQGTIDLGFLSKKDFELGNKKQIPCNFNIQKQWRIDLNSSLIQQSQKVIQNITLKESSFVDNIPHITMGLNVVGYSHIQKQSNILTCFQGLSFFSATEDLALSQGVAQLSKIHKMDFSRLIILRGLYLTSTPQFKNKSEIENKKLTFANLYLVGNTLLNSFLMSKE